MKSSHSLVKDDDLPPGVISLFIDSSVSTLPSYLRLLQCEDEDEENNNNINENKLQDDDEIGVDQLDQIFKHIFNVIELLF